LIYPKILKLKSGNDLLNSLKAVAVKENKNGYILSVVGNLTKAIVQCPGKKQSTIIKNHLEIISLNGTLSPNKCHLHISFSDEKCNVWAGHLKEGTIIYKDCDMLIGFLDENISEKDIITSKKVVEIYIIPDCPWSSRAVRMLRTLQVPHHIKVIENDNDYNLLYKKSNYSSFPQVFINGKFIGGYSELADLHASGKLSNY
tara:strand:- start:1166 stop:1768 length:603 start_codon:yes stop_codon:yes gene_type:complete